jgi:hypothetical protein
MRIKITMAVFLLFFWGGIASIKAQVTIGSETAPDINALLELKQDGITKKGLLLPRVVLTSTTSASPMTTHVMGMVVYNTATAGTLPNNVTPGYYYNDGAKWVRLLYAGETTVPRFFYMPSIVIPTSTANLGAATYDSGTQTYTIDLFDLYNKQYGLTAIAGSGTPVKSAGATTLPSVSSASALEYFITYYDNTVYANLAIAADGKLTYKVVANPVVTAKTYMNIVLKIK